MNGFFLATWIGCQILDGTTTHIGLNRGGREVNPFMKSNAITLKIGVNLANGFVWYKARSNQRKIISLANAMSGCIAGSWNLHQLNK